MQPVCHTLPMYLEAPSLPEPSTTLIFYKNMNTDTHDNDTYNIKLVTHHIFHATARVNRIMPDLCCSVYKSFLIDEL